MKIDTKLKIADLAKPVIRALDLAGRKARALDKSWDPSKGTPVFTIRGQYTTRGWTEWTQGFQDGLPLLAFDATNETDLLAFAREHTLNRMAAHVTHIGVHDHGFNNLSTYGNLRRLMREGRIPHDDWEMAFYEMAMKCSGAVQAARWTDLPDGGYIYSFNGPHSLFIDTMRTIRILGAAHQLGHVLTGESDRRTSLLGRLVTHGLTTARYSLYYGKNRDGYDVPALRGRTTHEAIFNINDGRFRCPNSQQGYSPFSTWTRGLAWAILGFAEELEFLKTVDPKDFPAAEVPAKAEVLKVFEEAARATADFYIDQATALDGIPYWDTGAPSLHELGDWQSRAAEPFNDHEPVDSSAAAIAAQGLLRLGRYLGPAGGRYLQAGLTVARTLFSADYLAEAESHQGLLLHSVYHRPNGWDYIPPGGKIPCGESSMWGDYHAAELAIVLHRLATGQPDYYFFDATKAPPRTKDEKNGKRSQSRARDRR
jgi:unsaturated chondroitin disaccharide hydrolase